MSEFLQFITLGKYQVCSFLQQAEEISGISLISKKYGENTCEALPGLHAFTECESESAFSGKGKQSAIKVILKDEGLCKTMKELGQSYTVSEELMEKCEKYVCSLYEKSGADVNDALYCFAKKDPSHHSCHQLKMQLTSIQGEQNTRLLFGDEP